MEDINSFYVPFTWSCELGKELFFKKFLNNKGSNFLFFNRSIKNLNKYFIAIFDFIKCKQFILHYRSKFNKSFKESLTLRNVNLIEHFTRRVIFPITFTSFYECVFSFPLELWKLINCSILFFAFFVWISCLLDKYLITYSLS